MAEPDAGTKLTLLGDTDTVSPDALPDLYAYPEPLSRCWVRSNFITSLDGGATLDGVSGGLAGPGDRALFKVLRELADVVLVGAGTVRMEHYGGAVLSAAARAARQRRGQAELPPIAIVTASGRLDRDMKVFTASEVTPIVLTSADVAVDTRSRSLAASRSSTTPRSTVAVSRSEQDSTSATPDSRLRVSTATSALVNTIGVTSEAVNTFM
ncbi:hypothetical protein BST26_16790, partial [Mycolicibacterium insubricum]